LSWRLYRPAAWAAHSRRTVVEGGEVENPAWQASRTRARARIVLPTQDGPSRAMSNFASEKFKVRCLTGRGSCGAQPGQLQRVPWIISRSPCRLVHLAVDEPQGDPCSGEQCSTRGRPTHHVVRIRHVRSYTDTRSHRSGKKGPETIPGVIDLCSRRLLGAATSRHPTPNWRGRRSRLLSAPKVGRPRSDGRALRTASSITPIEARPRTTSPD